MYVLKKVENSVGLVKRSLRQQSLKPDQFLQISRINDARGNNCLVPTCRMDWEGTPEVGGVSWEANVQFKKELERNCGGSENRDSGTGSKMPADEQPEKRGREDKVDKVSSGTGTRRVRKLKLVTRYQK